jgi:hypothetical protein
MATAFEDCDHLQEIWGGLQSLLALLGVFRDANFDRLGSFVLDEIDLHVCLS